MKYLNTLIMTMLAVATLARAEECADCLTPAAVEAKVKAEFKLDEAKLLLDNLYKTITPAETKQLTDANAKAEAALTKEGITDEEIQKVADEYFGVLENVLKSVAARMGRKPVDLANYPKDQKFVGLAYSVETLGGSKPYFVEVSTPNPSVDPEKALHGEALILLMQKLPDSNDNVSVVIYRNTKDTEKDENGKDVVPDLKAAVFSDADLAILKKLDPKDTSVAYTTLRSKQLCQK